MVGAIFALTGVSIISCKSVCVPLRL
uniref:Uncharacterized protein n=1 Tax=Rhizophora mucronata TaxID=61149 RepID=A0A2P2MQQ5_RHIMU